MLRDFPKVHRWEETDDVFTEAVSRLHQCLETVQPESPRHFYNLAATHVRRVLIGMTRRYYGPLGLGANHDTNAVKEPLADSQGDPRLAFRLHSRSPPPNTFHLDRRKLLDGSVRAHDPPAPGKSESDGSIDNSNGGHRCEIVSPVLRGPEPGLP